MENSPKINSLKTRKSPRFNNIEKKCQDIKCESSKGKENASKTPAKKALSVSKKNKRHEKLKGKRYPLRSSLNGVRVLRSMSSSVSKSQSSAPVSTIQSVNLVQKKRKKKKTVNKQAKDEYSRIRVHVRYLLQKINYEQSLIDAYDTEGWKGLSMEKIRPEKELQRAKNEILHCKFRIRGQFKQLMTLLSEGKLEDNLFDSQGQISSEDIICAKCASKLSTLNNDIILCDGVCDRGFHQKCLTPPLLNEDIPPGDEGWLCPGCVCKIDCIDFINDLLGLDLSIEDAWEEIFPEAAVISAGDTLFDDVGLPSEDSEDDDYAPEGLDGSGCLDVDHDSAEFSEESFTSKDSVEATDGLQSENFGFPSDDSDDNDFDPSQPDLSMKSERDGSSSDESDFTSDTNDLKDEINEFNGDLSSKQNNSITSEQSNKEVFGRNCDKSSENAEPFPSLNPDVSVLSSKRNQERLDYKKLYDETFSHSSSESDEDFFEDTNTGPIDNQINHRSTDIHKHAAKNSSKKNKLTMTHATAIVIDQNLNDSKDSEGIVSVGSKNSSSPSRYFTSSVYQKLLESFEDNQYPNKETKMSLVDGLGITYKQVEKWFERTRCQHRRLHASKKTTLTTPPHSSSERSITTSPRTSLEIPLVKLSTAAPTCNTTLGNRFPSISISDNITPKKEVNFNVRPEAKASPINREELVMRELRKRKRQK